MDQHAVWEPKRFAVPDGASLPPSLNSAKEGALLATFARRPLEGGARR